MQEPGKGKESLTNMCEKSPCLLGAEIFDMEGKWMFLLQILVGIAALCGFLFLPSAWGIPIFLVWALQMIFWVFLQEYYPYADKIRGNPAAEYNGYRRLFCRKAVPSLASLAVPERSVLVQRDDDTLF